MKSETHMIIDAHAHLVPPSLLQAIRQKASAFPSVKQIEEGDSLGFSFAGNKPTRPVSKLLSNIEGRVKWMREQGIDKMIVGGWLDMFGNELPPEEGERWSRLANEHLASAAKAAPHFIPLALVPRARWPKGRGRAMIARLGRRQTRARLKFAGGREVVTKPSEADQFAR